MNKIYKTLAKLTFKTERETERQGGGERERRQVNKIRNESGNITTSLIEIKKYRNRILGGIIYQQIR